MQEQRERKNPGIQLTREQFLNRLNRRSLERYGGGFEESWLNDLLKDGMIRVSTRLANDGIYPVYFADACLYRRALQLKRLASKGITDRDAQRIQLFLRGYGFQPHEIRDAIRNEYIGLIRTLSSQMRSTYFRNPRDVGPGHQVSLAKQIGQLDSRFREIGLKQIIPFYIQFAREALDDRNTSVIGQFLVLHKDPYLLSEKVEGALKADDRVYLGALRKFHLINRWMFRLIVGSGIIDTPKYTTFLFVLILVLDTKQFSSSKLLLHSSLRGFKALYHSVSARVLHHFGTD